MNIPEFHLDPEKLTDNLLTTIILLISIIIFRHILVKFVLAARFKTSEERRRWIVQVRNFSFLLVAVGLVIIWASELRTLAFSIVAFAVALVWGFKEILSCILGSFLKSSNRLFDIGDRIEVNGVRGDVINHTFLATTLFEVGHEGRLQKYTGRTVKIPNAIFLTHNIYNETSSAPYFLHSMQIPLSTNDDWRRAEEILLTAAHKVSSDFIDDAMLYLKRLEKKEGILAPDITPQVFIDTPDRFSIVLTLRLPVMSAYKGVVEQDIFRTFIEEFYSSEEKTT